MIPHPAHQPPACARVFPVGAPGTTALVEHVLATGHGTWWTDRAEHLRVIAVTCGDHALLAGDPTALAPDRLAPLAGLCVEASARFLPLLGTAFDRLHPWDRMLYVHQASGTPPRVPRGVTVGRLRPEDGPALAEADPSMGWIHATWGGPSGLAASRQGWAAFREGRVLALACTRFAGSRYEDVACATDLSERRQHLALACVRGSDRRHHRARQNRHLELLPRPSRQPPPGLDRRLPPPPRVRPPHDRAHGRQRPVNSASGRVNRA
ncbi:GNAT family N-acetyltransferase [Streptomyces sp. NPDC004520]|uniref:GNAT family N-acetyltransferase n=1 Tax=Streptomyces sp. NPDC004520 TaxID=3364702 RepID=UPI0036A2DF5D